MQYIDMFVKIPLFLDIQGAGKAKISIRGERLWNGSVKRLILASSATLDRNGKYNFFSNQINHFSGKNSI